MSNLIFHDDAYFDRFVDDLRLDLVSKAEQITSETNQEPILFFVTTTFLAYPDNSFNNFTAESQQAASSKIDQMLKRYDRFYRHLLTELLQTRYYHRPKYRTHQPLTYMFVDFPHTTYRPTKRLPAFMKLIKESQTAKDHLLFTQAPEDVPHIHAVMLARAEQAEYLNANKRKLQRMFYDIEHANQSLDIQEVPLVKEDMGKVISYSAKFLYYCTAHYADASLYDILPRR